ncbi:MAG: hypothetical protein F6K23_04740 [Okeania sp. SIO2C9]|uniref:hypothetical protein n=1 Tax=Okeania sp. SIO2C9 TaxID=2607791 RepID=UPI0013C1A48A|nr:hypothetical protein [Okeania sp. SIO2C9]NEQ72441.1 hypothetical protein [Okeania sp. SIO2C9]
MVNFQNRDTPLKPVLSPRCFHLAGNGGLKGAVREVAANVEEHPFVFRTDVKGYYASINHGILMDIVGKYVRDDAVLHLFSKKLGRATPPFKAKCFWSRA